ncbi:hypothetical protein [Polyangium jinanense]|uniref:PD40 domain-containing protein n=1 Tax=Polyangium jinanense TaxID=2829994 RepID=A0A9X3X9L4_9BACT|nr:hypothetical protein [Polyangium jinanense]MDC3959592.1 PD40 domain-containing protein [Polyangium jinanense]MDC3986559.1 PD40 domain-containing protein [Polyangium jinanense]
MRFRFSHVGFLGLIWLPLAACKPQATSHDEQAATTSSAASTASAAAPSPSSASPAPPAAATAEGTAAPYLPPPEASAAAAPPEAPRKTIGTFDDWVKGYQGIGGPEAHKKPPRLGLVKDLGLSSGRITFTRSGDVFTYDFAKGAEAQLTRKSQRNEAPVFLGDGRRIAFLSNRDGMVWRVFLMNADGTDQRPITRKFAGAYGYQPSFAITSDGNRVAYIAATSGSPDGLSEELHLVDVASGEDHRVGEPDSLGHPAFSPKGDMLYLVAGVFEAEHLASVDVATRKFRSFSDAGNHMFSGARRLGDRLLFSASPTGSFCCQRSSLYTTTPDGSGIRGFGSFWVAGSLHPEVSPKGTKVAAAWSVREGGFGADYRIEISVLDANGNAERALTDAFPRPFYSALEPTWAPDDHHLAFTLSLCPYVGCEPTIRSVVVVDTRDTKAVPAFIAYGGGASWSPVP